MPLIPPAIPFGCVLFEMLTGKQAFIGEPRVLFGGKPLPALPHNPSDWDVPVYITPDGKRVLLPVPVETNTLGSLTLVTNWTAALQK